jgi:hypothetical protein
MSTTDYTTILRMVTELRARVDALESASGLYVSDEDLDDPRYGDPTIKFTPRKYRGPDCKGKQFSKADPAFLDAYADALAWMADHPQPEKEKYAAYNRRDAARARSWAKRLRTGWQPEPSSMVGEFPGDPTPAFEAPAFVEPEPFDTPSFDPGPPPTDEDIPF